VLENLGVAGARCGKVQSVPTTDVPRWEQLESVLTSVQGEPLVILINGHPDPDAIGCAVAHRLICERIGVPATIAHVRGVSHRENRALVKLLGLEMVHVTSAADLSRFRHLSLVDACEPEPSIEIPSGLSLLTVVDHHRNVEPTAPFVDLRPTYGAASSIYAEYLRDGPWHLDGAHRDAVRAATALLFGIQTDTDDFALATAADFSAAAYVRPFCDTNILKHVGRRTISATAMDVLRRALEGLVVVRDFAFAGVGHVAAGDRDGIGGAADFILQREDIDTVLVYGIVGGRIDGSLRTNNPSVDPATFLRAAFGTDRDGRPYGGGRADKGGFQIPLGMIAECDDKAALWGLVRELVTSKLDDMMPGVKRRTE
jgi:nanoRNase/pAp phosphatase (c-di-AMP/oligoRNAs hydrolase)